MTYQVKINKKAIKSLAKIPEPYYQSIKSAIITLENNPRPFGYRQLKGRNAFRIRVSDYRIIYEIKDNILLILVIDIGHRKEIYS